MLSVNVVSEVRTFTTTTGRTVYVLDGEFGFDLDALVAACTSKACAPPPVGTGGSLPTAVQHVTSREAAESIKKGGFVVGYGGMHGSQFGYGVYMSRAGDPMSKFYRKATQQEGHEAALVQGTVHLRNAVKVTGNTKDELFREIVKKLGGAAGVKKVAQSSYERLKSGSKSALRRVLGEDAVRKVDWDGEFETDPVFNDMTREQYGMFNAALSEFLPHGVRSFSDLSGISALRKMSSGAARKSSWLKSVSNLLADLGHDGIEVMNPSETKDVGGSQIVVFDPKTITVNSVEDFGVLISEFGIEVTLDYEPVVFACIEHGEFACNSKSCAPPPVGTGGSLPSGSSARGTSPLPAGASAEQIKEFRESHDSDNSPLWQGVSKRLVGADGTLDPFNYDRKVQAKVQANDRIIEKASKNPQFQKGLKNVLDQEIDLDRLRDVFQGVLHGDAVSDMVMEASRQGTGNSQGTPAWYTAESGTTVRQLLERLASDELYEGMRTNPLSGLTPEEIATRILTRDFVSGWAVSSNDSDPRSISKQMAAAEMHGIDYEKFYKEYRHKGAEVPKEILDEARRQLTEHRDILQGLTQSEYDVTQDFFKEQGITSVTLYRGVRLPQRGKIPNNGDVVESASNPLSSWTVEHRIAYSGFGLSIGMTKGRTFAMEVPVEMIQATPVTGRGCMSEYEVVVIGYPSEMLTVSGGDKWVA